MSPFMETPLGFNGLKADYMYLVFGNRVRGVQLESVE